MAIRIPRKVGEEKIVARIYSKSFISQDYEIPKTGTIETYGKFRGKYISGFILPITPAGKVVVIRQYRMGPDQIVLELPGGNIQPGEHSKDGAKRELLEETGYLAEQTISLSYDKNICHDPASSDISFYPFLCLNCEDTGKRNLDKYEEIEVEIMSWDEWLDAVYQIRSNSSYSMLTTLLAKPHLEKFGLI